MSSIESNPIHTKIFQSDPIQRSYDKKNLLLITHGDADLNLILVVETTNGFTFQIIDSSIQSRGVRLT